MPQIELIDIHSHYQGADRRTSPGLQGLSLTVADGEFLTLLGPSGAGKTTLLRLIAGLEKPSAGHLRLNGNPLGSCQPAERNVGMVFQTPALFPHLTVHQNLALSLTLRNVHPAAIATRVESMAHRLELTPLLARRPAELSSGEQQRLALGRAVIGRPAILLLDEPLSNLDPPLRRRLRAHVLRLHQEWNLTTLCVTHDLPEAESIDSRVAFLDRGRLAQIGSFSQLRSNPASEQIAAFLHP